MISLAEALRAGKLDDFVAQAEAAGVGPIAEADFNRVLGSVAAPKAPPPEDQTYHSPAGGASRGK